jgi:hypothetical protein
VSGRKRNQQGAAHVRDRCWGRPLVHTVTQLSFSGVPGVNALRHVTPCSLGIRVSEEPSASSSRSMLMMEAVCFSETLVPNYMASHPNLQSLCKQMKSVSSLGNVQDGIHTVASAKPKSQIRE